MAAFFGASVSPDARFAWRLRLYWALTSLLRLASERQPTAAAINLEPRAETQRRRAATRESGPSLASWLTSTFTCAPGVRGPIARRSAVREIIRGRVGTAVTAERTAGASAGEPSRRRRVSGERPASRHRADVAAAAHTAEASLTLSPRRNPRMRSSARTSCRPSATRRARCKSCTMSSRRRSRGPGSRSSSRLC